MKDSNTYPIVTKPLKQKLSANLNDAEDNSKTVSFILFFITYTFLQLLKFQSSKNLKLSNNDVVHPLPSVVSIFGRMAFQWCCFH